MSELESSNVQSSNNKSSVMEEEDKNATVTETKEADVNKSKRVTRQTTKTPEIGTTKAKKVSPVKKSKSDKEENAESPKIAESAEEKVFINVSPVKKSKTDNEETVESPKIAESVVEKGSKKVSPVNKSKTDNKETVERPKIAESEKEKATKIVSAVEDSKAGFEETVQNSKIVGSTEEKTKRGHNKTVKRPQITECIEENSSTETGNNSAVKKQKADNAKPDDSPKVAESLEEEKDSAVDANQKDISIVEISSTSDNEKNIKTDIKNQSVANSDKVENDRAEHNLQNNPIKMEVDDQNNQEEEPAMSMEQKMDDSQSDNEEYEEICVKIEDSIIDNPIEDNVEDTNTTITTEWEINESKTVEKTDKHMNDDNKNLSTSTLDTENLSLDDNIDEEMSDISSSSAAVPAEKTTSNTKTVNVGTELTKTPIKSFVARKHIIDLLTVFNEFNGKVPYELMKKVNSVKNPSSKSWPVEELKLDDDFSNCKICVIAIPKHWNYSHVRALISLKTTFDPNSRYLGIQFLPPHPRNAPNMKDCVLRFPTHRECYSVLQQIKRLKPDGKSIFAKMDSGYKIAKRTSIIETPVHPKVLERVPKAALTSKANLTPVAVPKAAAGRTLKEIVPIEKSEEENKPGQSLPPFGCETVVLMGHKGYMDAELYEGGADENTCKIVVARKLIGHNPFQALKTLIQENNCGKGPFKLKSPKGTRGSGCVLVLCPSNEDAKLLIKNLQGKQFMGNVIELELDIGYRVSRCSNTDSTEYVGPPQPVGESNKRTHTEAMGTSVVNQYQVPQKKTKYEDPNINQFSISTIFMPPPERDMRIYGLKEEYLKQLGIKPPLSNAIFINNLHKEVDSAKLYEIFSLAGNIKSLKLDEELEPVRRAKIVYDHPVEALQAVAMFNKQMLFHNEMLVKMDFSKTKRALPFGLQSIGQGLGKNGQPLSGVRTYVEMKSVQQVLAEMGILKEVRYAQTPFHVFSYEKEPNPTFNPPQKPQNQPTISQQPVLYRDQSNTASNTFNSNNVDNSNNHNPVSSIDGNVVALNAILARHGLIDRNTKCSDLNSILSAIRENRDNIYATESQDSNVNQNFMGQQAGLPVLADPNAYVQQNMSNVVQNAPNVNQAGSSESRWGPKVVWSAQTPPLAPQPAMIAPPLVVQQPHMVAQQPHMVGQQAQMVGQQAQMVGQQAQMVGQQAQMVGQQAQMVGQQAHMGGQQPYMVGQQPHMVPQPPPLHPPTQPPPSYPQYSPQATQMFPNVHQNTSFNQNTQSVAQNAPKMPPMQQTQKPKDYQSRFDSGRPKEKERSRDSDEEGSEVLLFNNLPPSVTIQALNTKMREVGELMFGEMTGKGRAVVRFRRYKDAIRCIRLFHRSKVDGQVIEVNFA